MPTIMWRPLVSREKGARKSTDIQAPRPQRCACPDRYAKRCGRGVAMRFGGGTLHRAPVFQRRRREGMKPGVSMANSGFVPDNDPNRVSRGDGNVSGQTIGLRPSPLARGLSNNCVACPGLSLRFTPGSIHLGPRGLANQGGAEYGIGMMPSARASARSIHW